MKKKLALIGAGIALAATLAGCESLDRGVKDFSSSISGLNRTVNVYTDDGNLIRTYQGQIDIQDTGTANGGSGERKVKFDLNGKRTIIYGGIVIVDEK